MPDATFAAEAFDTVIRAAVPVAKDTLLLRLQGTGPSLPAWQAGAHVALWCGDVGARHYSLTGPARDGVYTLGIKRDANGRGGTRWLFDNARPGAQLRISAPRNHFPLDEQAPSYLFLSGGIGVTPILSMLFRLRELGRKARLVHLCRSREDVAFADWLGDLADFHDVEIHVDEEAGGIRDLRPVIEATRPDTAIYCCGPSPMLAAVREIAAALGRSEHLRFEVFNPAPAAAEVPEGEFTVVQASTGRRIAVPKTKTMLAALREAGLKMQSECEYGVCGWCSVGVLDGEPRHFDSYLTEEEKRANKLVLPCVSRCASEALTLDI